MQSLCLFHLDIAVHQLCDFRRKRAKWVVSQVKERQAHQLSDFRRKRTELIPIQPKERQVRQLPDFTRKDIEVVPVQVEALQAGQLPDLGGKVSEAQAGQCQVYKIACFIISSLDGRQGDTHCLTDLLYYGSVIALRCPIVSQFLIRHTS